jgi:hypothetical protein
VQPLATDFFSNCNSKQQCSVLLATPTDMQVPGSFFAVKPVLRVLQDMPSLPLAEELVHGQTPSPVTYLSPETIKQVCNMLKLKKMFLPPQ